MIGDRVKPFVGCRFEVATHAFSGDWTALEPDENGEVTIPLHIKAIRLLGTCTESDPCVVVLGWDAVE